MSEVKQVKVDNWGIFFLQRLKHFFNRTDYCDLTLQFQDNAQLKVHRLVLSACTEYFELLERTCEMYEDCLVMPDDLQADVVVPIVNFMYTGQLEFRMDLLERLYQTSLVMNMSVLTKLLESHRSQQVNRVQSPQSYTNPKRYNKSYNNKSCASPSSSNTIINNKRSYSKVFESNSAQKYKKLGNKSDNENYTHFSNPNLIDFQPPAKKAFMSDPRPTRYELPEELEADNLLDGSFTNISYTSKPLMVHPETTKRYPAKRSGIFEDPSTSKTYIHNRSSIDIVECKKISASDHIFDYENESTGEEVISFPQSMSVKHEPRDSNQLFDQILDGGPKVTIETKNSKQSSNIDHAKIISEVLKKYPHLVKSNKNIKLKILNTPSKKKPRPTFEEEKEVRPKVKTPDYAYETEVINSKEAAKLIALGAENIKGPWICLICGAPGKAIHFSSYYKFRRHLVEVHNEKPIINICEYCGHKTAKRNYLLYHLYTKHNVDPPPQYNFPKCNICNYVALTEKYLNKHKLTHGDNQPFRCNVCNATFSTSNQLLIHIQKTGHKYSADRKTNLQCIYCLKVFLRESSLYAHLRTNHKEVAKNDGIIDISDDERSEIKEDDKPIVKPSPSKQKIVKYELPISFDNDSECDDADIQYQIQQQPDGNVQLVSKKPRILLPAIKHKILNAGFSAPSSSSSSTIIQNTKLVTNVLSKQNEFGHSSEISIDNPSEEFIMIDNNEYIVKDNRLIPKKERVLAREEYIMPEEMQTEEIEENLHNIIPTTSVEYNSIQTANPQDNKITVKKSGQNINQPIQIVVSNEEEYKALMASNHSIIFDDGDAGKTLTVLTTPHDNNIATTIDLNNTQPNDMMIIPEGYTQNFSTTVPGDNSNIVVVYSHPVVNDPNKEYQLITSQNLEAQFVTSAGMITQNYETVTTSAPVMSAHVIDTPLEDTWHNSTPQNNAPNSDMEIPISDNHITITPMEQSEERSAHDEQEVELPPVDSNAVEMHPIAESVPEPHIVNNLNETNMVLITDSSQENVTNSNETFVETISPSSTSNLNSDDNKSTEEEIQSTDKPNEDLDSDTNIVLQENAQLEHTLMEHESEAETSQQEVLNDDKEIPNINSDEGTNESETVENIAKEIELTASLSASSKLTSSIVNKPTNNDVSLIKAKEQIKNLTSEWSDDELDMSSQEQSSKQEDNNEKDATESGAMEMDQPELEESVENIQQEMEKQLARKLDHGASEVSEHVEPMIVAEDNTSILQNDNLPNNEETEQSDENVVPNDNNDMPTPNKTPDKISSLLNDWEDNDSQEDESNHIQGDSSTADSSINDKEIKNVAEEESVDVKNIDSADGTVEVPVANNPNTKADIELSADNKPVTKADDKIKSLVSDWVEDDEEDAEEKKC